MSDRPDEDRVALQDEIRRLQEADVDAAREAAAEKRKARLDAARKAGEDSAKAHARKNSRRSAFTSRTNR